VKTIGIIGGMSWESTETYYRLINEEVARRLGGFHSARIVMSSVDFEEIERIQATNDWEGAGRQLGREALKLERAGADFLLLATNTMHKVADAIEAPVSIPLLHIADATGKAIVDAGVGTVGLLGTRYTMEMDFYRARLADIFGLRVIVPGSEARAKVNSVIFEELVHGVVLDTSRRAYLEIVEQLIAEGAAGVILGCTEIGMLIDQADVRVPVFDTTVLHTRAAVEAALGPTEPE
jgi:aspartate racemase